MEGFDDNRFAAAAAECDAVVNDGKVYISVNELLALNSAIAQIGVMFATLNPQVAPAIAYPLDVYRALIDALTARFASEVVPDSPEALEA